LPIEAPGEDPPSIPEKDSANFEQADEALTALPSFQVGAVRTGEPVLLPLTG
jgi:hypothetical protein